MNITTHNITCIVPRPKAGIFNPLFNCTVGAAAMVADFVISVVTLLNLFCVQTTKITIDND